MNNSKNILLIGFSIIFCLFGNLNAGVPSDPLSQMELVFRGNYTKSQIKKRLDKAMKLYKLEITKENYSRAGSVLVTLRKETGQKEMDILNYMIKSYVPNVKLDFPDAASLSAIFLKYEDY